METQLALMKTITLSEMKAVQLMNRVDQKYLTHLGALPQLLGLIAPHYYVQRIEGDAVALYRTLYFDTLELEMYTQHHNRKCHRQKLRIRTYRSTQTTFFELKDKDNKGKTSKSRINLPVSSFYTALEHPQVADFVCQHTPYTPLRLTKQLENSFSRITLVDIGMTERVTIDFSINFRNHATGLSTELPNLVIIEVKHQLGAPVSAIEKALQQLRIPPRRMSKYCIGTALTNPSAKSNRFKDKIRYINKIMAHQATQTPSA
ncbi:MAG: polyphosphate polymerase domain-containing protein [Bacteroidales bacterium]|nr:polyphosphate polymerase domain-containing protein [Bacteroidales bacterium]